MILYHGSQDRTIENFQIISRKTNPPDFGDGVYFTSNFSQARDCSCRYSDVGAVYVVDIDLTLLNGICLDDDDLFFYCTYLNRIDLRGLVGDCLEEFDGKDYICGKMIKETKRFYEIAEKFNDGSIEIEEFKKKTILFKSYDQYCFRSNKALALINAGIKNKIFTKKYGKKVIEETIIK